MSEEFKEKVGTVIAGIVIVGFMILLFGIAGGIEMGTIG